MKIHNKIQFFRLFSDVRKRNSPLIFALIFGLITVAVGLSQIFAQSSVTFLFSPTSQYANTNEDKSFTISLNSNGQQVDGGSVTIQYDTSLVSFTSFSDSVTAGVSISNKVNSTGSYSYDYQITSGSQNTPSLGTITLRAKAIASTQPAYLKFSAATTNAYSGSGSNRAYYSVAYGQAAMIVYAGSGTPPPPPILTPTPAPTPTPTPPASTTPRPTPPTNPVVSPPPQSTPTQNNITPTLSSNDQSIVGPPAIDPTISSDGKSLAPTVEVVHNKSPLPYLLIGGIILIGAGASAFYKFKHISKHRTHRTSKGLHPHTPGNTSSELSEKNIATKSETVTPHQEPVASLATTHHSPAVVTKHSDEHHKLLKSNTPPGGTHEENTKSRPEPKHTETPVAGKPPEQTITKVHEHIDNTHHKEVEVDILRVKPPEPSTPEATPVQPKAVEQEPVVDLHHSAETPKHPEATPKPRIPLTPSVVSVIATAPTTQNTGAQKPPTPNNNMEVKPAEGTFTHEKTVQPLHHHSTHKNLPLEPARHVPDWQAHLTVGPSRETPPDDDPPDMFELAADHPETFGSYQALEAEDSETHNPKKDKS